MSAMTRGTLAPAPSSASATTESKGRKHHNPGCHQPAYAQPRSHNSWSFYQESEEILALTYHKAASIICVIHDGRPSPQSLELQFPGLRDQIMPEAVVRRLMNQAKPGRFVKVSSGMEHVIGPEGDFSVAHLPRES